MEATGESGYKEVLQVFVNETEVITHVLYEDKEGNIQEIETTLNHRFMCEGEWKAAGTLKPGDLLTLADGSQAPVTEVGFEDRHETVYNMEVEDSHTYYVGEDGVWVHNTYQGGKKSTLSDSRNIRYSQDSISGTFKDGKSVNELTYHLKVTPEYALEVDPIRIVRFNDLPQDVQAYLSKQGVSSSTVFSLDNRRLYAAKQAGVDVNTVWVTKEELSFMDLLERFTTTTGGKTITVR